MKFQAKQIKLFNFINAVPKVSSVQIDSASGTILPVFGQDVYYNVAKAIMLSPSGRNCANNLATFYKGEGFSDREIYQKKINETQKFDELLNDVCQNLAYFDFAVLHVVFNPITKKVEKIYCLESKHVRYCEPNELGNIYYVKYNPTFYTPYTSYMKKYDKTLRIFDGVDDITIDSFERVIILQSKNTFDDYYAIPSGFSCLRDLNSDYYLSVLLESELSNGFFAGGIVNLAGNPNEQILVGERDGEPIYKTSKELFEEQVLDSITGVDKAGSLAVVWNSQVSFVPFKPENAHHKELIKVVSDEVRERIAIAFGVQKILANISVAGKLGGSSEYSDAVLVQNKKTEFTRLNIQAAFAKIADYLDATHDSFTIIPLTF